MQDFINLLPDSVANQIAAGEVIQRPASVVKELLENALDAGADNITLILVDSGKTLIQVVDNGSGMSETDLRMSIERHATSKLQKAEDLQEIKTMGFRGEALASIAAIAHLEIKSRTAQGEMGSRLRVVGSEIEGQEFCQMSPGTSISVRHLFFNVPARRKFLKSDRVELRHILKEFKQVALSRPDIAFSVHHNDTELYHLTSEKLIHRIASVLDKKSSKELIPIEESTELVTIKGYVGKSKLARKSRGDQYLFVNKRFIKNYKLEYAVKLAYEDLIPSKFHPLFVIYIEVLPEFVDINIHPTKQEIKFEDQRLIFQYLTSTVRHALSKYHVSPSLDFETESSGLLESENEPRKRQGKSNGFSGFRKPQSNSGQEWEKYYEGIANARNSVKKEESDEVITLRSDLEIAETSVDDSKTFQLKNSYIITQIKSGLLIIDQHYAHLRVLYEKNLKSLESQTLESTHLMFPLTLELEAEEALLLVENLDKLKLLGYDISHFGADTYIVRSQPLSEYSAGNLEETLRGFIRDMSENPAFADDSKKHIAYALAKNSAITKNRSLSQEEMHSLIAQLFGCEMPFKTPNGKKCVLFYDTDEISLLFNQTL